MVSSIEEVQLTIDVNDALVAEASGHAVRGNAAQRRRLSRAHDVEMQMAAFVAVIFRSC
jgi:hypothetical protein